jgi:hypothetical protein
MEAQDGRYFGIQISTGHCKSKYYTYENVNKRLDKVGLEGKEHNLIVSLRFSITKCVRGSYNQGIMKYIMGFVSI